MGNRQCLKNGIHASMMEILLSILKNNNNKKGGRKEMR